MPIIAVTPSPRTASQLTLSWGVETLVIDEATTTDEIVWFAVQAAVRSGFAHPGDVVIVLAGSPIEPEPATDTPAPCPRPLTPAPAKSLIVPGG